MNARERVVAPSEREERPGSSEASGQVVWETGSAGVCWSSSSFSGSPSSARRRPTTAPGATTRTEQGSGTTGERVRHQMHANRNVRRGSSSSQRMRVAWRGLAEESEMPNPEAASVSLGFGAAGSTGTPRAQPPGRQGPMGRGGGSCRSEAPFLRRTQWSAKEMRAIAAGVRTGRCCPGSTRRTGSSSSLC